MAGRAATDAIIKGRCAISVNDPGHPLPTGWSRAPLTDVADLGTGHTPSRHEPNYWDGDIPWIGIRDAGANHGKVINDTAQHVTELGLDNSAAVLLPKNTVCLSRTASVGYVVKMGRDMATSQDFVNWTCSETIDPDYLLNALLAEGEDIRRFGEGSTHTTIYFPEVKAFHIDLPPAAEQRRIVAKLDALTARIARARAELDRVAALASSLRFAALREAYQIASAYRISELGDLIETLDQGWSPKCENYPSSNDDEWAVLKTTAIQAMAYQSGENKVLPLDLQPRAHIEVRAGDILVTRAGPRVRCGVTCLVETTRPRLMLADKMYRLRCTGEVSPAFLAFMLNSPQALERIEAMKTGISDSGLNLTQGKFFALELPAPSIDVQNRIVDGLRTAFARADRMEAEAARARKLLDRLEQAILAKAFRGELVPQDPNDEPASVLLERIRAERAKAPKPKRGRRKASV
ncbi:type I restriction endonuclease subunit S [Fulvimarina endophytica]|uniref:Type I restriction endonuclease subunit S n=1 Tax=Fulvimarina endophytica TaxID=2293836 RepID=A0A371WZR2_9HYPH|nr:restriction endonuclease subunit S [Fulvimarina endophytica]RFC62264.1 type I restriction endonuclease subunit S [Fulvimarina endophytica]